MVGMNPVSGSTPASASCALCLKAAALCESHIFPEFFYQQVYDDAKAINGHWFHQLTTDSKNRNKRQRKGLREPLLCRACETLLSAEESYTASLFQRMADHIDSEEAAGK